MFFLEFADGLINLILRFLQLLDLDVEFFAVAAVLLYFFQGFLQSLHLQSQLFLLLQKLSILFLYFLFEENQVFVLLIDLSELFTCLILGSL